MLGTDSERTDPPTRGRRSRRGLAAAAGAGLIVLAACGSGSDDGGGDAAGPGDDDGERCTATVAGTELSYGTYVPASQIDPTLASGALVGGTELVAVYDVLVTYDYESGDWEPHLAESLVPNEDHTAWTLTLQDDITYSDGTPLTAELVVENMDRFFADTARNTSAGFMGPIEDHNLIDERTVEFLLDRPWPQFPFVLADEPGMIVNTNAIGDDLDAFAEQPPDAAGLGPYVVERNAPGEELVMVARDDYWGGPVCIERLRFVFRGAETYASFQAGDLDVAFLRDDIADIEDAQDAGTGNFFVRQDAGETLMINHAEGRPGQDPRVREAIMLAIDENVINERAFDGKLDVSKTLVSPSSPYYSDAIEAFPTDRGRAEELLGEAMDDGYDGQIELLCSTTPAPRPDIALAVQGQLEAVGFDVEVRNLAQGDQIGQVIQEDFDLACWGFNAGPDTGVTTLNRTLAGDSATNRMSYADSEMDDALLDLFAAADDDETRAAMATVHDIYNRDAATLAFGHIDEGIVWSSDVRGITPTGATMFMFHDAYLAG